MPRGSCLCGDIAYEIAGPFLEAHHCHCSMCRKEHGTPYATYGIAPASGMQWLRGREQIARFESSEGFYRAFCRFFRGSVWSQSACWLDRFRHDRPGHAPAPSV